MVAALSVLQGNLTLSVRSLYLRSLEVKVMGGGARRKIVHISNSIETDVSVTPVVSAR